jgi:cell division protease FtsH
MSRARIHNQYSITQNFGFQENLQMNKFDFHCIAGYHKVKDELVGLRNLLLNLESFRRSGVRMPRGVLLYGAPGVGKTVMARAIAGNDISLVELRSADCTREGAEDYVLEAFENARSQAPCILLIDELDKLTEGNDMFYMEGNDRVMKILLQELDGQKDNSGVMVVATCNSCDHINPALLRSGRFDRIIEIGNPTLEDRVDILGHYLSKIKLDVRLDVEYLAKITAGHTGAQLECMINESGVMAMQEGMSHIDMKTVQRAMNRIAFRALEGQNVNGDEQWRTAVHEAGHAVVAIMLTPESLSTASIIPHGQIRGHVRFVRDESLGESIDEIENKVIIAVAGSAAEEVILGKRYTSSQDDLIKARRSIFNLVWGIGAYGIEFAGYAGGRVSDGFARGSLGEKGELICAEKLKEFYERATCLIRENRSLAELIAHSLVEKCTLSREELLELYRISKEKESA